MPDEYTNGAGMTSTEIAQQLRKTYLDMYRYVRKESGDRLPQVNAKSWDEIPAGVRAKWVTCVDRLFSFRNTGGTLQTSKGAAHMADTLGGNGTYDRLDRVRKLMWQAIFRSCFMYVAIGMQESDGAYPEQSEIRREVDLANSYDWKKWLKEQITKEMAHASK